MCGLTGYLGGHPMHEEQALSLLETMATAISYRGPDSAGYWCNTNQQIGLGHRRLAIVDLSDAGHQPMASLSGRYVLVFNGEIYNHLDLRRNLELQQGVNWRGHSDTETLLAGFDAWGIEATVRRAVGMFALAIWDTQHNLLTLARDRMGEKPLYYGWQGDSFIFGSELKALKPHPEFQNKVDRSVLRLFLRYNYVPTPYSIYAGISKLESGCLLQVSLQNREPRVTPYWSLSKEVQKSRQSAWTATEKETVEGLDLVLRDAIKQQMIADVPLGAFLSGGVDSSTVVALMQAQSRQPIKTFTIGFSEANYSEAVHAKAIARHLGTVHTELYVTPEQAINVVPQLGTIYDEPFADSSQVPTLLVAQLARQQVTVSLSGDAGDELFCGYNRYKFAATYWKAAASIPNGLRKLVANGITAISPQNWDSYAGFLPLTNPGDKLHKAAAAISSHNIAELYLGLVSSWSHPEAVVIGGEAPADTGYVNQRLRFDGLDDIHQMMALDTLTYLPDDILAKIDRAAMHVSLESRVPFLDHRVVEYAWQLPLKYKLRGQTTKWALREVLHKYVPPKLLDRPKMGFGVPIDSWLRGPLRNWAEGLLADQRLRVEGYFNPEPIRKKWLEHLSGKRNWSTQLWAVLMFQTWLESQQA